MRRTFLIPFGWLTVLWALFIVFPARTNEAPRQGEKAVSFWDHRQEVRRLAFAPDGKTMATVLGNEQDRIAVWDLATMTRKLELTGITEVAGLDFPPDSHLLAASARVPEKEGAEATKNAIVVWDATSGKRRYTFAVEEPARVVRLTPDGKTLAVAGTDDSVTFWDLATGKQLSQVLLEGTELRRFLVHQPQFAPDLKTIAGIAGGALRVWDPAKGMQKQSLPDRFSEISYWTFAPDGKALVLGTNRGKGRTAELKVWDLVTGKVKIVGKERDGPIRYVTFSPDGKILATVNGTVRLRDTASGKEVAVFDTPPEMVHLDISPYGKLVATVSDPPHGGARLWDATTGKERLSPAEEAERDRRDALYRKQFARQERARAEHEKARPQEEAQSERRRHSRRAEYALQIGQAQGACERWRFDEARELLAGLRPGKGEKDLRGFDWHYLHSRLPRGAVLGGGRTALSADGEKIALALSDPDEEKTWQLKLLDAHAGKQGVVLGTFKHPPHALAFSPDGQLLATAEEGEDHQTEVKLWRVAERRLMRGVVAQRHARPVRALAFAPDGRTVASAGKDGTIRVWDVGAGKLRHFFRSRKRTDFLSVAFSPDGGTLAAGAESEPTRLWDARTGAEKGELSPLRGAEAIAFAPFTPHLATLHKKTVAIWDLTTRRPLSSFRVGGGPLLFVDQGQHLLCGLSLFEPLTGVQRASCKPDSLFDRDARDTPPEEGRDIPPELRPAVADLARRLAALEGIESGEQELRNVGVTRSGRVRAVLAGPREIWLVDFPLRSEQLHLDGLKDGVRGLAFSANSAELLALGSDIAEVKRWDASTGEGRVAPVHLRDEPAGKVLFREKGRAVVSVRGVEIPLADFAALGGLAFLRGNGEGLGRVLSFSANGNTLLAGGIDPFSIDRFLVLDTATGKERLSATRPGNSFTEGRTALSRDGRLVIAWSSEVVTWDALTGKELDRIRPPGEVRAVRFAPDGKTPLTLVIADRRGRVSLWEVATGETRGTLRGLAGPTTVKFSPDGETLATGDEDGTVRLWDAHSGHLRLVLRGHCGSIDHLAFRPDGRALAVAGAEGTVSLWAIDSGNGRK